MTTLFARIVAGLALAALAAAGAASGAPAPIAISASPSVLTLYGAATASIEVANPGSAPTTVAVELGSYDIAANGRVEIDPQRAPNRTAKAWLSVSPARLTLAAGATAVVSVVSHPPKNAEPGDHHALVLLTSAPPGSTQIGIRTRVGVGVLVRMPGSIERRLAVPRLRAPRPHLLELTLANRGNINERLARGQVYVTLRSGRTSVTLKAPPFDLLPGDSVTAAISYRGTLHGRMTATVRVRPSAPDVAGPAAPALAPLVRTFEVEL